MQKVIDQYPYETNEWPCFETAPCYIGAESDVCKNTYSASRQSMSSLPSPLSRNSTFKHFFFLLFEISPWNKKSDADPQLLQPTIFFSPQTQKLTKSLCSYNVILIQRWQLNCNKITERNSTPKMGTCGKREYFVNGTSEVMDVEAITGSHAGIPLLSIASLCVH